MKPASRSYFCPLVVVVLLLVVNTGSPVPIQPRSAILSQEKDKPSSSGQTPADHTYDDVPPLTFAVSSGALEEVEALLDAGVDVNKLDWLGQTALHMAAKFQQYECARALLIRGANHSIANFEYQETALHLAAKMGTVDIIQLLIDYGSNVNAPISTEFIPGGTPLVYAALYDMYSSDAVRILLENGADVNAVNSYSETALHISVRNQNIPNVQLLIDAFHANVNAVDNEGCTPLNLFARDITSVPQLAIPGLLIDHGANLENRCRKTSRTPLHNAVASMNLPVIEYLLKRGADIEAVDSRGLTPLFTAVVDNPDIGVNHAAFNNKMNIVRILLQHGANPNAAVRYNTPAKGGNETDDDVESVTTTVVHKLKKAKRCLTVLVGLAVQGATNADDLARLLVAYGAELNASNTLCPENDPVVVSRNNGNEKLSEVLWALTVDRKRSLGPIETFFSADVLAHKFDLPPFMLAIYSGDMKQVARQLLAPLTAEFDKTAADYTGQTALHAAVACKSLTVARVLLHLGADVNAADISGATPLHYAAKSGFIFMIELLLQYGAKLDGSASSGSPLVFAVTYSNSPETVQFLLEQGADVQAYGHQPTLLHIATQRQNIRMMKLLLQYGADIEGKTQLTELTPLGLLVESDCCYPQLPVLGFLLDHGAKIDARDVNMRTPLNAALALKKRKQVVFFLLSRGANPNATNFAGCNAPLYRVIRMSEKKLERYFRHSMSEDDADKTRDIIEIVKELLSRGADPTYVDKCSLETAVDMAYYTGQKEIHKILLDAIAARGGKLPKTLASGMTTVEQPGSLPDNSSTDSGTTLLMSSSFLTPTSASLTSSDHFLFFTDPTIESILLELDAKTTSSS